MRTRLLAVSSCFAFLALAGFALVQAEQGVAADAEPAVVISDFGCGLLDGNGAAVFTNDSHGVITNSNNDNTMVRCQADVTPSADGRAVRWNFENTGGMCLTQSGLTDQWTNVVSASGRATLTCHYRN